MSKHTYFENITSVNSGLDIVSSQEMIHSSRGKIQIYIFKNSNVTLHIRDLFILYFSEKCFDHYFMPHILCIFLSSENL